MMRKKHVLASTLLSTNILLASAARLPVSVHEFADKSGSSNCRYGWEWWGHNLGRAFKEMLVAELKTDDAFQVLERDKIESVYEKEHKLINSEKSQKPKAGKFKIAKYALVGALSEYEYCADKQGAGLDVGALIGIGSLKVGTKSASAKIAVDIRVIDVESGEVVKSARGEGKTEDSKLSLDSNISLGEKRLNGGIDSQKNSPLGKAARDAIKNAAIEIKSFLKNKT
jgi:curli biogenesis system outer membrane secretion channel CsgG